jgi:hypothetical protein
MLGAIGLIVIAISLLISLEVPKPSALATVGLILGALVVAVLVLSSRHEITLTLIALYLGLLEGPVKLGTGGGTLASASRDVLIGAVCLGAFGRLIAKRERVRLPPLSGWVLIWVLLVLVEMFNPDTSGVLKILGGFRQQLEWLPFFFFGYQLMRSKERLRKFFLLLGVIALANGLVGAYQAHIGPAGLAGWGQGYHELVDGHAGLGGRTYRSEGVARVRPPALGSNAGFGGGVGVLALPGIVALLAIGGFRRRWIVPILCLGVLTGIVTSASRTSVIGAVVALVGFALLSLSVGRRVSRPLGAFAMVLVLAFAITSVLTATEGKGIFSRFSTIASPEQAASTSVDTKEKTLAQLPSDIENAPFGIGLASAGAATGFGGNRKTTIEGKVASAEGQYNFVELELGVLGLAAWVLLTLRLVVLIVRRLPRIEDVELRIALIGVFAAVFAFTIMGFAGPTMAAPPAGPFFWFAVGIAGYWFIGPGWRAARPKALARRGTAATI